MNKGELQALASHLVLEVLPVNLGPAPFVATLIRFYGIREIIAV